MANKGRRIAIATGFVSGVIACLDAVRDVPQAWPPDVLWEALTRPHRLELCGGIAVMLVTLIVSIVRPRSES
jgi:hypothetical protein